MDSNNIVEGRHSAGWTAKSTPAVIVAAALILLLPAFYNRFPLIFPDTRAYLGVAYANEWTLDRSAFYGLMFKPLLLATEPVAGLWIAIALQSAAVAAVLMLVVRRVVPNVSPLAAFSLVAVTALTTALPWHAAQLMPDSLTGALILLVWLAASRNATEDGSPLLWLATAALALMHYTHIGLFLVAATVTLLVCAIAGTPTREILKRALAATLAVTAVIGAHVAAHGHLFGRWSVSPMGSYFLFARLHEDGLVPRWFDRHCGRDAPKPLCDLRPSLPGDSQIILWSNEASPLFLRINQRAGRAEAWRWMDMLHQAAIGSIREEPLAFAANAASATANQFLHFGALDDECPEKCDMSVMLAMRPALTDKLHASRQLRGEIPKGDIEAVTSIVATLGLVLLIPLFIFALRRRDPIALSLIAAIAAGLTANAFMAGALSDVHDRYQSRVVWLAPFAVILLLARSTHLNRASPLGQTRLPAPSKAIDL